MKGSKMRIKEVGREKDKGILKVLLSNGWTLIARDMGYVGGQREWHLFAVNPETGEYEEVIHPFHSTLRECKYSIDLVIRGWNDPQCRKIDGRVFVDYGYERELEARQILSETPDQITARVSGLSNKGLKERRKELKITDKQLNESLHIKFHQHKKTPSGHDSLQRKHWLVGHELTLINYYLKQG